MKIIYKYCLEYVFCLKKSSPKEKARLTVLPTSFIFRVFHVITHFKCIFFLIRLGNFSTGFLVHQRIRRYLYLVIVVNIDSVMIAFRGWSLLPRGCRTSGDGESAYYAIIL